MQNKRVKVLYYYETLLGVDQNGIQKVEPFVTFDKEFAQTQQGFRVGDLETLNFLAECGIWFKDKPIEIQEGVYEYFEIWDVDEVFGEQILTNVGYRKVEE